jgi:glutamyl/glutaminyl-tRNA synthetase
MEAGAATPATAILSSFDIGGGDHGRVGSLLTVTSSAVRVRFPPFPTGDVPRRQRPIRAVQQGAAGQGLKLGKAQAPVRVAVTCRTVGLPLFESLVVLGRERTLARLRAALDRLS